METVVPAGSGGKGGRWPLPAGSMETVAPRPQTRLEEGRSDGSCSHPIPLNGSHGRCSPGLNFPLLPAGSDGEGVCKTTARGEHGTCSPATQTRLEGRSDGRCSHPIEWERWAM